MIFNRFAQWITFSEGTASLFIQSVYYTICQIAPLTYIPIVAHSYFNENIESN